MTDAIDLTTEQRSQLITLLRRFLPGVAVWAYGSRVKWTARSNSDLDLVAFTVPEQRAQVADLKDALAESNLPFPVDLHVWDDVPERFREIIRKEYVVVQEAKEPDCKSSLAGKRLSVTAQEFCASVRDGTHDSPKPVEHGRSLVTSRHITGGRLDLGNAYRISQEDFDAINKRSKVDRWDVLISMIGTVGEPCLVRDDPDFAIKNIGLFKSKGEVEGRWLYYYLRTANAQQLIHEQARGTTQQYIPLGVLREFPIPVPGDPQEMCAIAHILGTLDDKIELNRKMNETLEAMARALFKSWFVNFDPVRSKAEGRDPGLPKHIADLFPDSFEDSELGEIPRGWQVGKVASLCDAIYSGGTPSTQVAEYWNGEVPWLSSGETRETFIIDTEKRITAAGISNSSTRAARAHSTVIASAGQGNTRGQTSLLAIDCYVNQSVVVLSANSRKSSPLHLFFDLERRYAEFRRISDGHSSRRSLTTKLLAQLEAVLPPLRLIEFFENAVAPSVALAILNLRETNALGALRDTLLPKLISGELRIGDAKDFIRGAL